MPLAPFAEAAVASSLPEKSPRLVIRSWPWLLLGSAITGALSLSMHTGMMQGIGVPYPSELPQRGWAAFCSLLLIVVGAVWLTALAWPRLLRLALPVRCIAVALLVAMLKETLFRRVLMNGFVSTAWTYSFIDNFSKIMPILFYGVAAVLLVSYVRSTGARLLGAAAIAGLLIFVVQPAFEQWLGTVLQRLAYLAHEALYDFPYGWQVLVPSYLTFVEPVVAGLLIAWLIWPKLSGTPGARLGRFVLLIMLLRGVLLTPFVNMGYDHHGPLIGFFSALQFTLEGLVLAVGLGLVWPRAIAYVPV